MNIREYFRITVSIFLILVGGATLYMVIVTKGGTAVPWTLLSMLALGCIGLGGWLFQEYLRIRRPD